MIAAGELRELVTIQQRASGVDAHGQESTTWTDLATVRAKAEPLRGRDFFAAAQTQSALSTKFTVRWRADLTGAHRVVWRGVPYDIDGLPIDVQGRRIALELMCTTGVRDGR